MTALRDRVEQWLAGDPDPATRAELRALLAAGDDAELADRFAGPLAFGTAGLRGPERAGPNGMNLAVVRRAAAGVAAWLGPGRTAVVGRDARTGSAAFARDAAAVLAGAGVRTLVLPRPLPTPVLAFAVRQLGADAGLMVTASHNPARDNGVKVYDGSGGQIVPPDDERIAARIAEAAPAATLPLGEVEQVDVLPAYLDAVVGLLDPAGPRAVRIAHTSLHGVGDDVVQAAFARAGFPAPVTVPEQATADPAFPTVAFPNPEEPGALDLLLALARDRGADIALAHDPDADRVALACPDRDGTWRALSGDETGALLGDWVLTHTTGPGRLVASTIVSSRLLGRLAQAHGVAHAETLTGFKWLVRAPGGRLVYAYEEALGHAVGGADGLVVRDKDGIGAALVLAELAAWARSVGRPLPVLLDHLAERFGVHATRPFTLRVSDPAEPPRVVARLLAQPPAHLAGHGVTGVDDLSAAAGGLPPTPGVRLWAGPAQDPRAVRVVVRPSGTEPTLKVYAEVVEPPDEDVPAARARAAAALDRALADVRAAAGL